jgi:hypothetical protein
MIPRKPLAPNNRKPDTRKKVFVSSVKLHDKSPSNKASVFAWARAGRQTAEGFGGGYRIKK